MTNTTVFVAYITTIIVLILLLPDASFAQPRLETVELTCGNQAGSNTSLFPDNFSSTMDNVSAQVRTSGFGIAATGSAPDTNYGMAQCYGDLSSIDCVLCYLEARSTLPRCYPMLGGRVYLDGCFMRSENYSFFEEYTGPNDRAVCGNVTRQDPGFEESTRQAVSQAVLTAPNNNGFARAQVAVSGSSNGSVYVLANCWRTLNASACRACLENGSSSMLGCLPSSEGRAVNTGCFMRYSDANFLNPTPGNGNSRGSRRVTVIVISAVSAAVVVIIGAVVGVFIWRKRMILKKKKGDAEDLVKILNDSSLNFKYSTLDKATGSFDDANKLGQGGFGTVYKGVLQDGREIAVKRLFLNSIHRGADFYNEVNIISSVDHKNLVRLLGCSGLGQESLLVFEYLPNKSLDHFIFDSIKGKELNWEQRFEIIIGTAEGLVYLHENTKTRIIHRDIKASNILLDSRLRAKIADFGLARSFQGDKSHISTAVAGTLGYMAPEYIAHGQLTEKADVYSFGVLLLEIVTGRENNKSKSSDSEYTETLINDVWKHFQQGIVDELFDPNIMQHNHHDNFNVKNEMLRVVHVGLLCVQENPTLRPTMSMALLMLKNKGSLREPTKPPFMDEDTMELDDTSGETSRGNVASTAGMSHSGFYAR